MPQVPAAQLLKPLDHADLLNRIGELLHLQWGAPATAVPEPAWPGAGPTEALPAPTPTPVPPEYARVAQEVYVAARFLDFPALRLLATH